MADTVGEFLIKLGLDANGIDKKINNVVNNVGSSLKNLATGVVAPALAGLASADFVKQFADEMTQVDRLSESLGMSVEQLSAWRQAAEMAGVEADEVGEIFADFNDWMVDAKFNEGGAMYTDFIQNGLLPAVTDANGEMKKTEDYILEFADALHKMDPAQAAGIARQIGLSDLKTASWIQSGGDAIRQQLELAKQIGTFTKEDTQAAKDFTISLTMLGNSVKMGLLPLFRFLVPILTQIAKSFGELVVRIRNFISQFGDIGDIGKDVANQISGFFELMSNHTTALMPLLGAVAAMLGGRLVGAIKSLVLASRAFIFSPWGAVITALTAIGIVLEDFMKWLNGDESKFGDFFNEIFGSADNAKNILNEVYTGFMEVVDRFQNAFSDLVPHFQKLGEATVNLFTAIVGSKGFELFVDVLLAAIDFIITAITSLIEFLVDNGDVIGDIITGIVDVITGIIEAITFVVETIGSLINSVIEIFTAFGETVSQICDTVGAAFSALGDIIGSVIDWIVDAFMSLVDMISSGVSTITDLLNSLMEVVSSVGEFIMSIFNAMASAFNSFVSAVSSGASTIIGWITDILNKLSELASNSLLGKVIGSIGGGVSALFSGGGYGNTDNSSTVYHQYNYGSAAEVAAGTLFPSDISKPATGGLI